MKVIVTNPRSNLYNRVMDLETFVPDGMGGISAVITTPESSALFVEKLAYIAIHREKPKSRPKPKPKPAATAEETPAN